MRALLAIALLRILVTHEVTFPARIPRIELDFVLVSKEIEINNFEVPDVRLSDHRPVLCDFTVRRAVASQPAVA